MKYKKIVGGTLGLMGVASLASGSCGNTEELCNQAGVPVLT